MCSLILKLFDAWIIPYQSFINNGLYRFDHEERIYCGCCLILVRKTKKKGNIEKEITITCLTSASVKMGKSDNFKLFFIYTFLRL